MNFQIFNRSSGAVQFECELDAKYDGENSYFRLGLAVKAAFKSGASLVGASLDGASLVGARLDGARLDGASLVGASLDAASLDGASGEALKLVGPRPVVWLGPIGRDQRTVYAFLTDKGVYVRAGCFWNTLEVFKAQVVETHGESEHAKEYAAFTALAEAHFALWPAS